MITSRRNELQSYRSVELQLLPTPTMRLVATRYVEGRKLLDIASELGWDNNNTSAQRVNNQIVQALRILRNNRKLLNTPLPQ